VAHVAFGNAAPDNPPEPRRRRAASASHGPVIVTVVDRDTEEKARAIELAARQRKPWSRGFWIAAIVISVACVVGLAVAWIEDRDTVALKHLDHQSPVVNSGLWLGLLVGLGLGIAIGSVLAARGKR
jgi:hypothetical protein